MIDKSLFQSKYPIVLAAMNKVSDLNLAVAASKSGIFPSISGFNYYPGGQLKPIFIKKDLLKFNELTGTNNLILSIELRDILRDDVIEEIFSAKLFSHVEIIDESRYISNAFKNEDNVKIEKFFKYIEIVKSLDVKPMFKILAPGHWVEKPESIRNSFSGAILKAADASGSVVTENRYPLIKEFSYLKNFSADKVFVPTGGISTKEQVKEFIDTGAQIVGVGAYFITAEECSISREVKEKLIQSNSEDIKKFSSNHNALIFSKFTDDDMNHTKSLQAGIRNPNSGHIYMSRSVDSIRKIKPFKDLVLDLVDGLI
jgi:hypothetical protein